jgi:TRAP-type uncharacterized transport system fused permease subunit
MWVFSPDLLLTNLSLHSLISFAAAVTVVSCFAVANVGYLFSPLPAWERALYLAIGLTALYDHATLRVLTICLAVAAMIFAYVRNRPVSGRAPVEGEE